MKYKGWGRLASVYIGTVIGAGFASGQEMIHFFAVFGYKGLFGSILSSSLFSVVGAIVFYLVYKNRIKGYEELITPIFGRTLSKIVEVIITSYLFISFCIMVAGSGAIFREQLNLSYNLGIAIMIICIMLTFMFSIAGIAVVNSILVPLLIIGIVAIGGMAILKEGFTFSNFYGAEYTKTGNWLTSAVFYMSYNSIAAIVIMTSMLSIIPSEKAAIKGGIIGGLGLGVLSIFIVIPLLILFSDINTLEIPMLSIAGRLGSKGGIIYAIILWCAMFTTAVANGFGCIRRLSTFLGLNQRLLSPIFCIAVIPLSKLGFSNLVSTLYPIFGYLGFFIVVFVIGSFFCRQIKGTV